MRLRLPGRTPAAAGEAPGVRGAARSPLVAAVLSFLIPGLGQASAGRPRRGLVVAIPAIAMLIAVAGVWLFARHDIFATLVSQQFLATFLALDLLILAYRVWVIVDAYLEAGGLLSISRKAGQMAAVGMLAVLVTVTAGMHLVVAAVDMQTQNALNCIFSANGPECWDFGVAGSGGPSPTVDPSATVLPDDNSTGAPSATNGPTASTTPGWAAQFDAITARSSPGVDQPAMGTLNTGDSVVGVLVSGGSYTYGGTTSTDWIHITSGNLTGTYVAKLFFSQIVPLAPGQTATPVTTQPPVVYQLGSLPSFTGAAKDWAADGQLNVLLIGIDAGVGEDRNLGLRPDSMILLHVDLTTGRAAMLGIPRDLINVPLPPETAKYYACHCYGPGPGQLKADFIIDNLWNEAANVHPAWYSQYGSGNDAVSKFLRGLGALKGAVSELTNVQVDGAVVINLPGFVKLIDALAPNGLNINVPYEVKQDPKYAYSLSNGNRVFNIDIKAGQQVMNGEVALEYARLRHVPGYDSDYFRMKRQQLVLRAVRDQINPCGLLPQIADILGALSGAVWTDLPQSDTARVAALAAKVGTSTTANFSLDPATTGATYDVLDQTSVNKIHDIVAHSLDSVPAGISGGGGGSGSGLTC
ncbi:MAG TPA: LCP family protein [Candidatus Limnocylindrales bacterium]